ncbi:MAG: hypothetical protein AAF502_20305 [Bacteroidota bacterium]
MKTSFSLIFICLFINTAFAQNTENDFQSDPVKVLEEVFRAAAKEDFSNLHLLCPEDKSNDGDTQKYICDVAAASEQEKREFVNYFKSGKITGEAVISTSLSGVQVAKVPFWFNHPGGESRANETMNLIRIEGKWYLSSF